MITDDAIRSALDHLADQAPDPRGVRGRLAARTRAVRRRRLLIASAAAAVVVGAGLAAVALPGHRTGSTGAQVTTTRGAEPTGTRATTTRDPDGAAVLRDAALAAEHEQILPARPDQFVFVESISQDSSETYPCDGKTDQKNCAPVVMLRAPSTRRVWQSVDGTRDGLLSEQPRRGGGAWRNTPLTVCPGAAPSRTTSVRGAETQAPTCASEPDPAYRADLPTNVDAMAAYLDQQTPERPDSYGPREARLFTTAGDLLQDRYLPPASLAAVFGALAKVPGLTVTRGVVDAAGRSGIAVGYARDAYRNELVFDPKTYAFLAARSVTVRAADGLRPGTVIYQLARLRVAIVDKAGQLPR